MRRVWGIPYRTHNHLLPGICNDRDIEIQLLSRSIKFLKTALSSQNLVLRLCGKLAAAGSRSALSNTVSYICDKFNVSRPTVTSGLTFPPVQIGREHGMIRDFAIAKHEARGEDRESLHQILIYLCTD